MAPALTEPLNPADKLSSATTSSPNTRSSKRLENTSPLVIRERRNRITTKSPTIITRKKRTKVIAPSLREDKSFTVQVQEQTDPEHITEQVQCINNNEQMGLSAAPISTNNNSTNNNKYNNNNQKTQTEATGRDELSGSRITYSEESKDNSTAQLLADLTNDFEEAITAEICLRRQLVDSNLEKSRTSVEDDRKDIIVIKVGTGGAQEVDSTHMESPIKDIDIEGKTKKEKIQILALETINTEQKHVVQSNNESNQQQSNTIFNDERELVANEKHSGEDDCKTSIVSDATILPDTAATVTTTTLSQKLSLSQRSERGEHASQLPVEELPTISTDSTMSASEAEDNIEERLSQLDGNTNSAMITTATSNIDDNLSCGTDAAQSMQGKEHVPQQIMQTNVPVTSTAAHHTTTCGELEDQDLEEVLKALKGFDGNAAFDGDLNNLFNEVYTTLNYDDITGGAHTGAGGNNASSMNPTITSSLSSLSTSATVPYKSINITPLQESQAEIKTNHSSMQRRIDNLLKRMRKIQARHMCKHVSEEIAGLFEWSARHCSKGITENNPSTLNEPDDLNTTGAGVLKSIIASRPPATLWTDEKKNILPLRQVSIFMRRLDSAATAQQINAANASKHTKTTLHALPIRRSKKMQEAAAAASTTNAIVGSTNERKIEEVVPIYDNDATEELTQVTGLLHTEMREVQNAYDSDATESSSGGESADEMVLYNNQLQQTRSISKRSPYRYSRDRGSIASRWCWLVSQVADLEIRIRQLQDLSHEIRRTKGAVVCGLEHMLKPTDTIGGIGVNGFKGDRGYTEYATDDNGNDSDAIPDSARTRGFQPKMFRKRKLLQTANIHTISKKAARPSTTKCGCQWPLHPCALCTGRADPTAPRDPPDTMMKSERVALLDPCYHPVLSFPEDVATTIYFEAITCQAEWQLRVMRCQAKNIAKSVWKAEREAAAAAGHSTSKRLGVGGSATLVGIGDGVPKRRYIKKKDRLAGERAAAADAVPLGNASLAASTATSSSMGVTAAIAASHLKHDEGNGTANLSTTPSTTSSTTSCSSTTTPLVANNVVMKQRKNRHYYIPEDIPATHSKTQPLKNIKHPQTSDYHQIQYEQYNLNRTPTSLIGNNSRQLKNNQQKNSITALTTTSHQQQQTQPIFNSINSNYNNINNNSYANANSISGDISDSWDRSRTSSPTHSQNKHERLFDRKNRVSYDIDNIVIPYSVAAATRVEIIPYKEIPTPKWRLIEDAKLMQKHNLNSGSAETGVDTIIKEEGKGIENNVSISSEINAHMDKDGSIISQANETVDSLAMRENIETNENSTGIAANDRARVARTIVATKITNANRETKVVSDCENSKPPDGDVPSMTCAELSEDLTFNKVEEKQLPEQNESMKHNVNKKVASELYEPIVKKMKIDLHPIVTDLSATTVEQSQKDVSRAEVNATNSKSEDKTGEEGDQVQRVGTATMTTHDRLKKCDIAELLKPPPPPPLNHTNAIHETKGNLINYTTNDVTEENEIEDISDDAMILRHERALAEERRKFQTFLKFPWSTRSRANRRMDSRTESSGANTPDPSSPAPRTPSVGGGDNESIPSPLAPSAQMESIAEMNEPFSSSKDSLQNQMGGIHKRSERRRTTSAKREMYEQPFNYVEMPPYEPLKFPLSNELYQHMLSAMPNNHKDGIQTSSHLNATCSNRGLISLHEDIANVYSSKLCNRRAGVGKSSRIEALKCRPGSKRGRKHVAHMNGKSAVSNRRSKDFNGPVNADDDDDYDLDDPHSDNFDNEDDDNEFSDYFMDFDDDDYPKHHLAPPTDSLNGVINYQNNIIDEDYPYQSSVDSSNNKLINSDGESSESEPFQDDETNDPEWKGGTERIERSRRKL